MLKVLDLFSGIGGFSLGLERTGGFETVAFCEINPFCRQVLAKHWPGVPIHDDIQTLSAGWLAEMGAWPDVICGGFPCQDLSYAGKGAGLAGERSGLWREYARLIGEIRPAFVIVENVAALLGRGLGDVLGDLAAIGYDAEWHCIPASAVGAPHIRDRLWVVAYPEQIGRDFPILSEGNGKAREWSGKAKRRDNRFRPEMGSSLSPVSSEWLDQPNPDGMVDGFSDWPHRLGALGNAVVPQIPEMIGHAILSTFVPSREDRLSDPAVMPRSGVAAPFVKMRVPVVNVTSFAKEGDT